MALAAAKGAPGGGGGGGVVLMPREASLSQMSWEDGSRHKDPRCSFARRLHLNMQRGGGGLGGGVKSPGQGGGARRVVLPSYAHLRTGPAPDDDPPAGCIDGQKRGGGECRRLYSEM